MNSGEPGIITDLLCRLWVHSRISARNIAYSAAVALKRSAHTTKASCVG